MEVVRGRSERGMLMEGLLDDGLLLPLLLLALLALLLKLWSEEDEDESADGVDEKNWCCC